jgi:uncharacterized repeat protein (TIGR03803 family)
LYGTTFGGEGAYFYGTVFRITIGGVRKVIYSFSGSDGNGPDSPLAQGADGNLYGTTVFGGANNTGEVFKLTLLGQLTVLHSFDLQNPVDHTNSDGAGPGAGLLLAPDGVHFYGTASVGGANAKGTIFEITTAGTFNKLFDFTGNVGPTSGYDSESTLMEQTNGSFYGLTKAGGANNAGVFYSLSPPSPIQILIIEGPVWLKPGDPVEILGNNLSQVVKITFGGVQAQFQLGTDTHLRAQVPSDAVDGLIIASLATGQQVESQMAVHILPKITNLDPTSGPVGTRVGIVGGGFVGTKKVAFGGVKATSYTVVNATLIQAIVPPGARTGKVTVATRNGNVASKQTFTVN